jgi:acetyl esterase/lipase
MICINALPRQWVVRPREKSSLSQGLVFVLLLVPQAAGALSLNGSVTNLKSETNSAPAAKRYEVEVIRNVGYRKDENADTVRHKLDLYLPRGEKKFPVIIFVHGGSWKSGSKDEYPRLGELFAQMGLGCVIPNYRLTPQVQHPAHVQDIAAAFAWTFTNIPSYGGRNNRIFLMGHSAGGHLVALLATDPKYLRERKRELADIRGVIALSGVHQIYPALPMFRKTFGPGLGEYRNASPINHVRGACPPFLLLYADGDLPLLGRMAEDMNEVLKKHGCASDCVKVPQRNHISILTKLSEEEDLARNRIIEFVAQHSEWKPPTPSPVTPRSNR